MSNMVNIDRGPNRGPKLVEMLLEQNWVYVVVHNQRLYHLCSKSIVTHIHLELSIFNRTMVYNTLMP
jgi:hypothetical protein